MPPRQRSDSGVERGRPGRGRRRSTHSLEAILETAIAMLDEAGEQALTFRALAARLGGGVGSLYWYVSGRDELLDRATDAVMAQALAASEGRVDAADPIDNLRELAVILFETMLAHPWVGAYLMRSADLQPHSLELYERFGQQTLRLDLTSRQRFHAVSALLSFVMGVGTEMSYGVDPGVTVDEAERAEFLGQYVQNWLAMDPARFPFLHEVADEFARHQDEEQFRGGLELLLDGIRLQADGGTARP